MEKKIETKKQETIEKKDNFNAKLSFILSLGFFIPLFNIGLAVASIILAINSIRFINKYPDKFSGLWYAITALAISVSTIILTIIFISVWLFRRMTCDALPTLI